MKELSYRVSNYYGLPYNGNMMFGRFQFKFRDRIAAAEILGDSLKSRIKRNEQKASVVLGIPRGGIITADIIAQKLSAPFFDIVIPRKLTDPINKEHAIGSVMEDDVTYLDQEQITQKQIPSAYLEMEKAKQIQGIERWNLLYRRGSRSEPRSFLNDKTIILVDDGAETGATVIAATRWIKRLGNISTRLIVAVPIAPKSAVDLLKKECTSEVEVVIRPSTSFRPVEQYHRDFRPISDEEVVRIMKRRNILSV